MFWDILEDCDTTEANKDIESVAKGKSDAGRCAKSKHAGKLGKSCFQELQHFHNSTINDRIYL